MRVHSETVQVIEVESALSQVSLGMKPLNGFTLDFTLTQITTFYVSLK